MDLDQPSVFPSRDGGPASREGSSPAVPASGEARGEIDWNLLTLLLAGERRAPIVLFGADLERLAPGLVGVGAPIIPLSQGLEGMRRQTGAIVSPVCWEVGGDLPLREASVGAVMLNQVMARPPAGPDGEPLSIHPGLLMEMHRVLRTGGILCLVVSQRRTGLRPGALRAWLEQCGFGRSHIYLALPGHRQFTALTPLTSGRTMRSCIELVVQGNTSRERWLRLWLKSLAILGLLESRLGEYVVLGWKER